MMRQPKFITVISWVGGVFGIVGALLAGYVFVKTLKEIL